MVLNEDLHNFGVYGLLANIKNIGDIKINTDELIDIVGSMRPLFQLRLSGFEYKQTVPYNLSTTLVELQKIIYRSYALVAYGSPNIGRLTDSDKQQLDMPFRIDEGSSKITFDLTALIIGIITGVSDKMTSTAIFITVLIIIVAWTSSHVYQKYIDSKKDEREDARQAQQLDIFSDLSKEREQTTRGLMEVISTLAEHSHITSSLHQLNTEELPELILKAATQADSTEFNGVLLDKDEASQLSRKSNEEYEPFEELWVVRVLGLNTTNEDNSGWKLRVYNEEIDKEFTVTISSPDIFDVAKSNHLAQSLLQKSLTNIKVSGRKNRVGTSFKDIELKDVSA